MVLYLLIWLIIALLFMGWNFNYHIHLQLHYCMTATYLGVMTWTSIYPIWVCFHIININPKMPFFSFSFGGFCLICIIIHWDLFCSVIGNICWKWALTILVNMVQGPGKKKKDGDVRLSKRLGFELQYHPLNKEAFFICTCILLHEILIPHLMTNLSTKHSFLIWGRQFSLSGVI